MPNQPSAIELEIEVPGSPEDVWTAVATGPGISSWYVPHEVEERPGGLAVARFGPGDDMKVPGRVTIWEPPRRIGFAGDGVDDGLTFEWTVSPIPDSRRCVVRLVNAGFGQGGPWDAMYDAMVAGWRMFLSNLRLHLEHFPGAEAASALPTAAWTGSRTEAWDRLSRRLGLGDAPAVGDRIEVQPDGAPLLSGSVVAVEPARLTLLLDGPSPGTGFLAVEGDGDEVQVSIWTYRYGTDAQAAAAADQAGWQAWLAAQGSA